MKNIVNIFQSFVAFFTAFIFGGMALYCIHMSLWIPVVILVLLTILFLYIGVLNCSYIEMNEEEVCRRIFNVKLCSIKKCDLKEVGVLGLKVLGDKKKTGTRYIYFSAQEMDDEERFQMCLKWPPKDKIYMTWNESRYIHTLEYWNDEIIEYNAGTLGI